MTDLEYNVMRRRQCDEIIPQLFHVHLPVQKFLADDLETGPNSYGMLFESGQDTYLLIIDESGKQQTLADVRSIVQSMGLTAQRFFPPHAEFDYFYREGVKHFLKAYPGRTKWKQEDITFYQSLAAYPVALVRIAAIGGEVRRYSRSAAEWHKAFNHSYNKIPVFS